MVSYALLGLPAVTHKNDRCAPSLVIDRKEGQKGSDPLISEVRVYGVSVFSNFKEP